MFLECCGGAADVISVISELSWAAIMMVVRHMPNGIARVESCVVIADCAAVAVASLPDTISLALPISEDLLDCASVALGELVVVTGGAYRALADDVVEVVLL